jgi:DNA-binding MarR family transcriptional regulator
MSSPRTVPERLLAGAGPFREFLTGLVLNSQISAEAAGLGPTDFYTLNLLGAAGPLTAGQVADRTGLTTGAVTRLIDRLARAGHVRRVPDPVDRRRVRVELEPSRATGHDPIRQPALDRLTEILADYPDEALDVLFEFFGRAAPALRDAAEQARVTRHQA